MPVSLRRGTVSAIVERHDGLVRLEVDGAPCVAYPHVTGPVALGDDVVVNVQARELDLGTGGFDVLHTNLTRGLGLASAADAHVMKLPYTPLQFAAPHAEEETELPRSIDGLPVVACSLHSQVAPASAALRGLRVAYVQLAGGALPVPLSDALRELRKLGLVELSIGVGPCFGGDLECVDVRSALALAHTRGFDAVVCSIGPGVVGTGSLFGHGGMAAASAIDAALALGGRPVLAVRVSERDPRERHRGVSHHSEAVLAGLCRECDVAWPAGCPIAAPAVRSKEVDVADWRDECAGLSLSHMGCGPDDDPWFFAAAFAAGRLARSSAN